MTEYREGKPCATCGSTQYVRLDEWRCAECDQLEGELPEHFEWSVYVSVDGAYDLFDLGEGDDLADVVPVLHRALRYADKVELNLEAV